MISFSNRAPPKSVVSDFNIFQSFPPHINLEVNRTNPSQVCTTRRFDSASHAQNWLSRTSTELSPLKQSSWDLLQSPYPWTVETRPTTSVPVANRELSTGLNLRNVVRCRRDRGSGLQQESTCSVCQRGHVTGFVKTPRTAKATTLKPSAPRGLRGPLDHMVWAT